MNTTNRLWHVVAAVALALLAAMLTTFYVSNYKRNVQHSEGEVTVLVASKDIPADMQGADIVTKDLLTKVTVARRQVVPGAISRPEQIRNLITTQPVYAGEQVTTRRFGTRDEAGVRAKIHGRQRAVEFDADPHQLLAGTLRVGDHVDIVGSWNGITRVFLRDIIVLSVPGSVKGGAVTQPGSGVAVQLRLTDAQAQRLEWMKKNGDDWRLALRPPADAENSPRWYDNAETLMKDGVGIR